VAVEPVVGPLGVAALSTMMDPVSISSDVVFRFSDEEEVAIQNHDASRVITALEDVADAASGLGSDIGSRQVVFTTADEVLALTAALDLIAAGEHGIAGDLNVLRHRLSGRARRLDRSRRDAF
jgi:hypothetical protein